MTATWESLQVVRDCLESGRLDDAELVLAEMDAAGAWDFALIPYSRQKMREILANAMARTADTLLDPDATYEAPSPYEDLANSIAVVQDAYRYAIKQEAPEVVLEKIMRWLTEAGDMLYPITAGSDAIVATVRSWVNVEQPRWGGVFTE